MHTTAKPSLVITESSSLKRFTDFDIKTSYAGFYQLIVSSLTKHVHPELVFRKLGDKLTSIADNAHALRRMDVVEEASDRLVNLPLPRRYKSIGQYYQALCVHRFGFGDTEQAARLLEAVIENAPPRYRVRAMQSLGSNSIRRGDYRSALSLYYEAELCASRSGVRDPLATVRTQKDVAVINSLEGNHRGALAILENLFALSHAIRSADPHVYYDYLNGLAVELCEVGRLEEAKNVSQIVLASPFAPAYPEWRETSNEIALRGRRASRSVVAFHQGTTDAALSRTTADVRPSKAAVEAAGTRSAAKAGKLLRLPVPERAESNVDRSAAGPATLLDMQAWKKKMTKPDEERPRPTTTAEKEARLKELEKMTTREKLTMFMTALGDERVGDELLLKALIILEELEPDENEGA